MSAIFPSAWGLYRPDFEHDACGIGFIANIQGAKSHRLVQQGIEMLNRMEHRGAAGADPDTGDGAGILVQLSHRFFKRQGLERGWTMPRRRRYGVGMVFLPPDPSQRRACESAIEAAVSDEGQRVIGWRDVPVDPSAIGQMARASMPVIRQVYVAGRRIVTSALERKLFVIRKLAENRVRDLGLDPQGHFHIASMSAETIVYKGLLLPEQLPAFYDDLRQPDFVSAIAVVHSRFSTNTFPSWQRAQPSRFTAHNGEINTLRGNRNSMKARAASLESAKFGAPLSRIFPVIDEQGSDSFQLDNMLELLHLGGRPLHHAMMMMIPEAWQSDPDLPQKRRDFYAYASSLMEPWDGPAAIVFTDGFMVGATLDRNGLRPARYVVTTDGLVVMSSEVGVLDLPPSIIAKKGRLRPGRMLLVDTVEGEIVNDAAAKNEIAGRWPYGRWIRNNVSTLGDLPQASPPPIARDVELLRLQRAFGYTDEDLRLVLEPMARDGKEPIGSMGTDVPLAVLSDQAPPLFDYFHQLFAQVTNPPIDPIRESLVMTLQTSLGPNSNTFEETPEHCQRLALDSPVLTCADFARIQRANSGALEATTLSLLFDVGGSLEHAVDALCAAAQEAVEEGYTLLVLSDRGVDTKRCPIPSLLATSAVHQHLVREGIRNQTGLVIESGDARTVHHIACLFAFGATVVCPWLALESLEARVSEGALSGPFDEIRAHYLHALERGVLKVMSKMGISTLQSYRGAQIFEAVGLNPVLIDRHFTGTPSRVKGVGLRELGREVLIRHQRGYHERDGVHELPAGGVLQWRRRGELHKWNPSTIAHLQHATRGDRPMSYKAFAKACNDEDRALSTLRGQLELVPGEPISVDQVEPASAIMKRFATGAMSFGSLSAEAHETLAVAMNRVGGKSNSGEGGEEARRYAPAPNGDRLYSRIHQVASGRFGVDIEYLTHADELQIKMAQGAKPGEGGQLPGEKVDERIAAVRCSTPGVTLISPPPHHDIYSIEDLAQLIHDLKCANARARISVKLVSEVGVGTVAAGVAKAGAGHVVIAGNGGGTGASPVSSIFHAGLPWELGLAEAQQVLVQNDLRGRLRVQVDGGLRTGRDVVIGGLLGAEEFAFSTAPLVTMGCILLRKCHLNTCSVGIATQDPELRALFAGQPEHVIRYFSFVAEEVRELMASLGFRTFDELVGRVDRLRQRRDVDHWKAATLDLSEMLASPQVPETFARRQRSPQPRVVDGHLDQRLLDMAEPVLGGGDAQTLDLDIRNTDRTVGAHLSGEITRRLGAAGLPEGALTVRFTGTAGQSFGAFLTRGVRFELSGDANDGVGKGLSGGVLALRHPVESPFRPEEQILIGNVALYGATRGKAFIAGRAGERFAVRNSGASAVVEGVGDHGCEYMTGGVVVCLGETGRNFAAGMSGGTAFVYDETGEFPAHCNRSMVGLESLVDAADLSLVYELLCEHVEATASRNARRILDNWSLAVERFVKVMPHEYRRVLQQRRAMEQQRLSEERSHG
ncbi:MAG: glutamate synthase large subunit [Deltaproteobacteria bacterium]|nr:MAG: glutamate synthase large subunit [Deltaproteobacteria bacterium]